MAAEDNGVDAAGWRAGWLVRHEKQLGWALAGFWLLVFAFRIFYATDFPENREQLTSGALAAGVLHGLAMSPWCYQYMGHTHGPLIFSLLLLPFYWLDAPRMLWIKLVGGCFAAAGVFVWVRVARRAWGPAAALALLVLLLFPPPVLEHHFHLGYANHMESIFFTGALLLLFLQLEDAYFGFGATAFLGFFAGFALFFSWDNLPIVATVAAAFCWRWGRRGLMLLLWPAGPAFLLGFFPHWLSPWRSDVVTMKSALASHPVLFVKNLLLYSFPEGFGGRHSWMAKAATACMLAGLAISIVAQRRKRLWRLPWTPDKDWLSRALWLFAAIFVGGASLTNFYSAPDAIHPIRHLLPLLVAGLAFVAFFVSRWPGMWKWLLWLPLAAPGVANIFAGFPPAAAYFADGWRDLTQIRGEAPDVAIDHLQLDFCGGANPGDSWAAVQKMPPSWRDEGACMMAVHFGPAAVASWLAQDAPWLAGRREIFVRCAASATDCGSRGGAAGLGEYSAASCVQWLDQFGAADPKLAAAFVEGYAFGTMGVLSARLSRSDDLARDLENFRRGAAPATTGLRETIRVLFDQAAGRGAEPFAAFLHGIGRWRAVHYDYPADKEALRQYWASLLAGAPGADSPDAFARGYAEGQAWLLAFYFRSFTLAPQPMGLTFANLPGIRDELAKQGFALREGGGNPTEYFLERAR
jgi:hypothetical protein